MQRSNFLTPIYLVLSVVGLLIAFGFHGSENGPVKISITLGALVVICIAMEIYMGFKDINEHNARKSR